MRKIQPEACEKIVEECLHDVVALSEDPYFSRVCIVQEVVCSDTRLMLQSGQYFMWFQAFFPFSALSKGTCSIGTGSIQARVPGGLNISVESLLYTIQQTRRALEVNPESDDGRSTATHAFITSIMDYNNKQCSDLRDKMFAFRSMPTARLLERNFEIPLCSSNLVLHRHAGFDAW
jgi:hypothetical protein